MPGWSLAAAAHLWAPGVSPVAASLLPPPDHLPDPCRHLRQPPSFKEFRQIPASLCFTISISNKNSDYKSFPTSGMLKRNQIMSANHPEFIVAFSSSAAHWNHLGGFKKHWCLGYTQRFWFSGLGCNGASGLHTAPQVVPMGSPG